MKKIFIILIVASSCQKLKPESVSISDYPDYEELMIDQVELLANTKIRKEVWLDGKSEIQVLSMDSTSWMKELSFLKEINPNRPEYAGAFEKVEDQLNQTLVLKEGEKGALKKTTFSKDASYFLQINATFHEDKDLYIHHREIALAFENGVLNSLHIAGYQKMMFKDTVKFRIALTVN
ncbi:MAG: hypothetical protein ABJG47_05210 [Ekhidna sp.]